MKKFVLMVLCLLVTMSLNAQSGACNNSVIIGHTTIVDQTNRGNIGRLIYEFPDQTLSAVWVYGNAFPSYPDRGTGYNFYNGTNWDPIPLSRIENLKTNFPNITGSDNLDELIYSHQALNGIINLSRNPQGSGPWNEFMQNTNQDLFPRMAIGGPNGQYIHLVTNKYLSNTNGQIHELNYYRSPDLGTTWDIQSGSIPGLEGTDIRMSSPDIKNISCRGNIVAIIAGGFADDLILSKSIDNGNSWTKTIINQFPLPLYDEMSMITDINNDGIADTVTTTDQSSTMVIDSNGMVHVWAGKGRIIDDDLFGGIGFFPLDAGLVYWNESMGSNTILNNQIADLEDLNNDGIINIFAYNFKPLSSFATSMASAGINASDELYVIYSAFVEDTINPYPSPITANHNIYLMHSNDYGQSWSIPERICPNTNYNQIFPSMAEKIYADPKIIFFGDTSSSTTQYPIIDVIFMSPQITTSANPGTNSIFNFMVYQHSHHLIVNTKFDINNSNIAVSVHDITGKQIYTDEFNNSSQINPISINMSDASTGIYFVKLNSNNATGIEKVYYQRTE